MKSFLLILLFSASLFSASAQTNVPDTIGTDMGPLVVVPIEHASLILKVKGLNIFVDPANPDNFRGMGSPDIILVTDIHGDHFDLKTIDAVKKAVTVLIVPQVVADKLPPQDKEHIIVMKNGEQTSESGITINAIPMYNLPESSTCHAYQRKGQWLCADHWWQANLSFRRYTGHPGNAVIKKYRRGFYLHESAIYYGY